MKKNDLILVGICLLLGIVFIVFLLFTRSEGSKLLITVNGIEYETLELNKDTTYTLELDNGQWNTFVIKDGYVDMTDASCPDGICVNHNDIHFNNETIVCLPNRVVLQILEGEESDIDAVAK